MQLKNRLWTTVALFHYIKHENYDLCHRNEKKLNQNFVLLKVASDIMPMQLKNRPWITVALFHCCDLI
jgi:hypothetical protein